MPFRACVVSESESLSGSEIETPLREATGSSTEIRALAFVSVIFFMWGLITSLNDVLIPHLKSVFDLDYAGIMLVQFMFFGAYFVASWPSGWIVARLGYPKSMFGGLVLSAVGAFLFFPAAAAPSYPMFLLALFVLASGITLLQVAANPYVSLLGPPRGSSSRLNLAQALNSLGTILGPAVGGVLILSIPVISYAIRRHWTIGAEHVYMLRQTTLVQGPYVGLGLLLLVLALVLYVMRLPEERTASARPESGLFVAMLRRPRAYRSLLLAAVAIFVYVGAEVTLGSFMISYISRPRFGGIPVDRAALFVSFYWTGAMIGRFVGSWVLRKANPRLLLGGAAVVAAALVTTTLLSHGMLAVWSVVSVGLFNAIMFPTIFALGIEGLGPRTGQASSLLVMAIVGGAIIPLLQGFLADRIGIHHAYVLPLLCYGYIVFYGFWGSRPPTRASALRPETSRA